MKLRYFAAVRDLSLESKPAELNLVPVSDSAGRTRQRVPTHELCDTVNVCRVIQLFARVEVHAAKKFTERFRFYIIDVKRDEAIGLYENSGQCRSSLSPQ